MAFTPFNSKGQFIQNKEGETAKTLSFFNPSQVYIHKIKSIKVEYSTKMPLKPIVKKHFKSSVFIFDNKGRVKQNYSTAKLYNGNIDTAVEWNYYQNDLIINKKSTFNNRIKVETYYYENNSVSNLITGYSDNESNSKLNLNISNYYPGNSEFFTTIFLPNKDTLTKIKSENDVVFRKKLISWKEKNEKTISILFPYAPENNKKSVYRYKSNLLMEMTEIKHNVTTATYIFSYNSKGNVASYNKYNGNGTETEYAKFIYESGNEILQAILIKEIATNNLEIKKFNYTYY